MKSYKYHSFISYPSSLRDYAKEIAEYLNGSGLKVYWDRYLIPGDDIVSTLVKNIKESNSIIVVIGPQGLGPWQSKEVDFIHWDYSSLPEQDRKRIIPVVVAGGNIQHSDVPNYIKGLRHIEFTQTVKNNPVIMQELIKSILMTHVPIIDDFERPITIEQSEWLMHDTINFYDVNAERYYETWKSKIPLEAMGPFLKSIKKGSLILDAGCGPGHHSLYFQKSGYSVHGIDLSTKALQIAKNHKTSIPFTYMDMRNMQFDRNVFDAVWACGSTVHLPREMMMNQLFEFLRVVKPGGIIGLSIHIKKPCEKKADGRFFESYSDRDEIIKLLEYCMFSVISDRETTTTENTMRKKRVKTWLDIVAQAPNNKHISNP